MDRRGFLTTGLAAGAGAISAGASSARGQSSGKVKILAINCSPRKGKTTSKALETCLQAARQVSPKIKTQLIELGDLDIRPCNACMECKQISARFARPAPHQRASRSIVMDDAAPRAGILNPARLPIPPLRQASVSKGLMSQGAARDGPRFYQVITRLSTVSMKSPQAVGPRPDGAPPRAAPAGQDSRTLRATCQTRVVPQPAPVYRAQGA